MPDDISSFDWGFTKVDYLEGLQNLEEEKNRAAAKAEAIAEDVIAVFLIGLTKNPADVAEALVDRLKDCGFQIVKASC